MDPLSRRERQVMDILHRVNEATVAGVQAQMDDPPTYNAVRALLGTMVSKGHLTRRAEGRAYHYTPTEGRSSARKSALKRVVNSFFGGSPEEAAMALLGLDRELSDDTEHALRELIEQSREEAP